jgi:hypothetical protein
MNLIKIPNQERNEHVSICVYFVQAAIASPKSQHRIGPAESSAGDGGPVDLFPACGVHRITGLL